MTAALAPASALAACGPIVLDAGHGGADSGAVGPNGLTEKEVNLDIAKRTRGLLRGAGYPVVMTRETDISPNSPPRDLTGNGTINVADDLQARADIANRAKAAVFVAIHNNASLASGAGGTETYYWSGVGSDSDSARLAKVIQKAIVSEIGLASRGVLGANFYVLRRTNMPAALVEGGFISNPVEEALLGNPSFRQKIARGIFRGIERYTGPPPKHEPTILKRNLKPGTRVEIDLNDYLCERSTGARVTADVPITAERSMYFDRSGQSGGTVSRGAPKPSKTWYLAEGSTQPGFDSWLLLANPTQYGTTAKIKYMTETGSRNPIKVFIPAFSRRSVHVNKVLSGKSFGAKVTAGRPIVVERSVYFKYGAMDGAHTSIGVMSPAKTWYFAAGKTSGKNDTWVLLLNPGPVASTVRLRYITPQGEVDGGTIIIPAYRRRSISVDRFVPDSEVSVVVEADRGIVAERVLYFDEGGIRGGSATIGTRRPSRRWYFAAGDTRYGRTERLVLFNPGDAGAIVDVEYMLANGFVMERKHEVAAGSRLVLNVDDAAEAGTRKRPAVRLVSSAPIVAERLMFFDWQGYSGGHASIGSLWMSKRWYFAEGFTGGGHSTRLIVANPTKYNAKVKVRLLK